MNIGIPQAIYLVLVILGIGFSLANFGKDKGRFGWADIFWAPAISLGLLYWGGFFSN